MIIAPWTRLKMQKHGIIQISREDYDCLFWKGDRDEETLLHDRFFFIDGKTVITVDNSTDEFWQEEFTSVSKAVKWLAGECEVES